MFWFQTRIPHRSRTARLVIPTKPTKFLFVVPQYAAATHPVICVIQGFWQRKILKPHFPSGVSTWEMLAVANQDLLAYASYVDYGVFRPL